MSGIDQTGSGSGSAPPDPDPSQTGARQGDESMIDAPTQNGTHANTASSDFEHTKSRFQLPGSEPTPASSLPAPSSTDPAAAVAATTAAAPSTSTPSTNAVQESTDPSAMGTVGKKKGQAVKKPRRPKGGGTVVQTAKSARKALPQKQKKGGASTKESVNDAGGSGTDEDDEEAGDDDESDNGPYCICRGPDDHRFMIGCDVCEDWFHGECINIAKDVGENLIERFVCPNCTDMSRNLQTVFKKTCSYRNCVKPARLYGSAGKEGRSAFCSDEHRHLWWEKMIASLPKKSSVKPAMRDQLTQEEFMTLLGSELIQLDAKEGTVKVMTQPFVAHEDEDDTDETKKNIPPGLLTDEEEHLIQKSAKERYKMGEEIVLCQKMLEVVEMAKDRREALVKSKTFENTACLYDYRLDAVGVQADFAQWLNSDEGKEIFRAGTLEHGAVLTGDDKTLCDKKKCKAHAGWAQIHAKDVMYQMKLLASEAKKQLGHEKAIREAAMERKLRNLRENNRVVHDDAGNEHADAMDES